MAIICMHWQHERALQGACSFGLTFVTSCSCPLQVSGTPASGAHGLLDSEPAQAVLARLVEGALDRHSALRQRASLALLQDCRVYTSPPAAPASDEARPAALPAAANDTSVLWSISASAAVSAPRLSAHAADGSHAASAGQHRRLTPAELQQRLIAEVPDRSLL